MNHLLLSLLSCTFLIGCGTPYDPTMGRPMQNGPIPPAASPSPTNSPIPTPTPIFVQTVVTSGVKRISHWRFADPSPGQLKDELGNHHGVYHGTPSLLNAGPFSSLLSFLVNGPGSHAYVPNSPEFNTGKFTIATWVKVQNPFPVNQRILEKGGAYSGCGYELETTWNGQGFNCWIWNSSGLVYYGVSSGNFPLNQWHYVACTYDGANVKLYVNGVNIGTHSGVSSCTNSDGLTIGKSSVPGPSGDYYLRGNLSEMSFFDGALSDGEIVEEFNRFQ